MKGIFNLRPPLPKYTFTWDVGKVISYLKTLFPLENISLKFLTLKLAALLALTTAQRAQTLVNLNTRLMDLSDKSVIFALDSLQKTDRQYKVSKNIVIESYKAKALCPVYTLSQYLERTHNLRKDDNVLVSFKNFCRISTSTLARWLKTVLHSSGIDITKFQAHSFRGASTSAAFRAGVSLNTIMKTANWSSAKTFKKFYCKELQTKEVKNRKFSNAVLSV